MAAAASGWSPPRTTWTTPTSAPVTRRPRAFGSGVVFLERLVTGARHVEVQVIADGQGTAWALGVRDCSIQRRNQKVDRGVGLAAAHRRAGRRAQGVGRAARARGRATAAPARSSSSTTRRSSTFAFLEVNTRLQVEHSITELTTDIDLVKAQIHVAAGGRLEGEPAARERPRRRGAAQRRGPRPRLRARAGADRAARAAGRPGHPGRHRRQRGRHHPAPTSTR